MNTYRCVDYFDRWKDAEGDWTVNNVAVVEEDIRFDPDECSDREIYRLFCRIAGYKTTLRSIEVVGDWDYYIEFIYTAQSVGGYFPLGRFERTDV